MVFQPKLFKLSEYFLLVLQGHHKDGATARQLSRNFTLVKKGLRMVQIRALGDAFGGNGLWKLLSAWFRGPRGVHNI